MADQNPFAGFTAANTTNEVVHTNSVATATQRAAIDTAMVAAGGPLNGVAVADRRAVYMNFVWLCYDLGTSRNTRYPGNISDAVAVPWTTFVRVLQRTCTVRQFCASFAKIIYSQARALERPPQNWLRKGYTEATKYAAFDFFYGVEHASAIAVPEGIDEVHPTQAELVIANANATVQIQRSRNDEQQQSTYVELTRGRHANSRNFAIPP